jgi:predicted protein tyrosine phosphatase
LAEYRLKRFTSDITPATALFHLNHNDIFDEKATIRAAKETMAEKILAFEAIFDKAAEAAS